MRTQNKKVCVDIDGTLTMRDVYGTGKSFFDTTPNEYFKYLLNRKPNIGVLKKINDLYAEGYEISLFTSRPLYTRNITERWLEKVGCKYHYLQFNKPFYDVYIDDKAYRPDEITENFLKE